jgi:preprotein translocase subunit SecG
MLATVLLVVHLMIAAGLVGVVLLQRSEGGALGIGGSGGGGGGFLTGRGTANMLTRITAALAAAFFTTSLLLSILAQGNNSSTPLVGTGAAPGTSAPATVPVVPTVPLPPASGDNTPASNQPRGGVLDKLQGGAPSAPASK